MKDALDWLERYCSPDTPEGPKCAGHILPEQVRAGDVMADGSILGGNGCYYWTGKLWLLTSQAYNATYYGWHLHAEPICCDQSGRPLRLVSRA